VEHAAPTRDQQIADAQRAGDWRTVAALETTKLADLRPAT
jgi:hypothetical protein